MIPLHTHDTTRVAKVKKLTTSKADKHVEQSELSDIAGRGVK